MPPTTAKAARMSPLDSHALDLDQLSRRNRLRALRPRLGHDFSSNDYLGLAADGSLRPAIMEALARGVPIGSGGSRLLRGNHEEHEALEREAASFFGAEAALFFSSGYAANTALLSTLPQRGDLVVHDELIHASGHEGLRLGRAESLPVKHNEPDAFEAAILAWRNRGGRGRVWIAVESLYSMDGDRAPLDQLSALANAHDAVLIIDEAHATGVFGQGGRGLAADLEGGENVITLRTCGKALGCEGALVCGPAVVRDFLVNRARSFIFSTAPSPLMASAVRAALRIVGQEPQRRESLHELAAYAEERFVRLGATPTGTQILPLVIGDDKRTMQVAETLQMAGFDVRGIRPPTVPVGTSRLRISLTLNVDRPAIDELGAVLERAIA